MAELSDGFGSTIEGALLGRAAEPAHGEDVLIEGDAQACLNCGVLVPGAYCSNCGQKRRIYRSLMAIAHDLVHGVLHLDGKLWRTLPLLTLKPGEITRRYIEGERASFVSPMSMFLFSVFAMFAVFQMVGLTTPTQINSGLSTNTQISSVVSQLEAERDEIAEDMRDLATDAPDRPELQEQLGAIGRQIEVLNRAEALTAQNNTGKIDVNLTGIRSIDDGIVKKWRENPGLVLYKLQANGYKFSWLLIPLSIPFVWLVFAWRRQFKAYDHATFVTYSLSFMSLLFIAASLLATIQPIWWLSLIVMLLVPPAHIYRHLRGTYALSRFSAFWRLIALSFFIWIVALLFLQALLLLGAF